MKRTEIKFTHKVRIVDIRKLCLNRATGLEETARFSYKIQFDGIDEVFYVPAWVFESALDTYFLNKNYTRKDLLSVDYNLVITYSSYYKYNFTLKCYELIKGMTGATYLSFIEVSDSGPLDRTGIAIQLPDENDFKKLIVMEL
jgi:phage tail protein X